MKSPELIELQRKRLDLMDEARSILREMDSNPDKVDELARKHDAAIRALDMNALDLDEAKLDEERASNRPDLGGSEAYGADVPGLWRGGESSEWIDQRGQPVRVIGRGEKFGERNYRGPSVGDVIRAKITGARNDAEARALSEGTDSAGGFTVPTPLAADFIDRMRQASVSIQAGARTVPMTSETLAIARAVTDPGVAWRAENAAVAENDPTYDRVTFTAKTLAGGVKMSRELAEDSINIGAMLQQQLAAAMALELDRAAIWGDGTANSPTGVLNTVGINSIDMGTNGAAIADFDRMLDAIYELTLDNVPAPYGAIMHPRTQLAIQKLKETTTGNPLTPPEWVRNTPAFVTTAAPIDETQGTATDASSVVFGNYSNLLIGMRTQLEIRIYDQTYASTGQLYVQAWMRADVQLAQPKAFCALRGIIPAA